MNGNGYQPKKGVTTNPPNTEPTVQTPRFRKSCPPPPPRRCVTTSTESMPQYQTDYIISWDSRSGDATCVIITKISRDGTNVVGEIIGSSYEDSGCVSLSQTIEWYEERKRLEEMTEEAKA